MPSDCLVMAENNAYCTSTSTKESIGPNENEFGPWIRLCSYLHFSNDGPNETDTNWSNKGYYDYNYFYCGTNDAICYSKNCIEGLNGIQVLSDRPVFAHTMYSDEPLTESKYDDNAVRIWENKGVETGARVVNRTINEDNYHSRHFYYFVSNDPDNNGEESTEPTDPTETNNWLNPDDPNYDPVNPSGDPEKNPVPEDWHVVGSETYGNENLKSVPKGFYYTTIFHFADGSVAMTDIKQKR